MKIAAVDEGNFHMGTLEGLGGDHAAKTASEDDDTVRGLHAASVNILAAMIVDDCS
ncbi:MAG: hypothetical protein PVS2B2_24300 [Candidatus Acidiferrum sp.]